MAAEGRAQNPDLEIDPLFEVIEQLRREPYTFGFFQAVRLLQAQRPRRQAVGKFAPPQSEAVRFSAHSSLSFPASEIQSLEWRDGGPPRMMVNFMGLTGPLSALPLYYTEYVTERLRNRDTALRDFFDIFNHRMISLFYRAWEKHQFASPLTGASASPLTPYVLDLVGLGTPGLNDRQDVPDDALAYYSGLLAMHSRSATALEGLIEDYFQIPAKVEDFIGVWRKLDSFNQCLLEEDDSCGLGTSAVIGDEIFDHSRVRIRIGPLTRDQYRDFLPGGEAHRAIRALTKAFSSEVEYELQLVLQGQDVAGCVLETEANARPLGWLTWIRSNPDSASDARDDTLLLLE